MGTLDDIEAGGAIARTVRHASDVRIETKADGSGAVTLSFRLGRQGISFVSRALAEATAHRPANPPSGNGERDRFWSDRASGAPEPFLARGAGPKAGIPSPMAGPIVSSPLPDEPPEVWTGQAMPHEEAEEPGYARDPLFLAVVRRAFEGKDRLSIDSRKPGYDRRREIVVDSAKTVIKDQRSGADRRRSGWQMIPRDPFSDTKSPAAQVADEIAAFAGLRESSAGPAVTPEPRDPREPERAKWFRHPMHALLVRDRREPGRDRRQEGGAVVDAFSDQPYSGRRGDRREASEAAAAAPASESRERTMMYRRPQTAKSPAKFVSDQRESGAFDRRKYLWSVFDPGNRRHSEERRSIPPPLSRPRLMEHRRRAHDRRQQQEGKIEQPRDWLDDRRRSVPRRKP